MSVREQFPVERIIIAAVARNRVMGRDGGLPWNVPEDYQQFLDTVRGEIVLMGRVSWESFGGDLDDVHAIVLTSRDEVSGKAEVAGDLESALRQAGARGTRCFIAGGAEIYREALEADWVTDMYLSWIEAEPEGDLYFPAFAADAWEIVCRQQHRQFEFVHYRRKPALTRLPVGC